MPQHIDTYGWVSCHMITVQCADCDHVIADGRMCACDLDEPGFPKIATCPHLEVTE